MRKLLALLAVILLSSPGVIKVGAAEVTVDLFYRSLEPHGEWVETADYGYVWHPREVQEDWRPYTVGNWAYTDAGWTWVSEEPFGWATYHYGRWVRVESTGWVWVPDTEWAPAWVSWRRGPKHVGWAPLPPEARFRKTVGIKSWSDTYYDVGPEYYSFVEVREFGSPRLARVVVPPRDNITIIRETKNITNITVVNNYVFNGGPEYEVIVRESAEPIRRLRIERRMDIDFSPRVVREDVLRTTVAGDTLRIVTPDVRFVADARPARVARRLDRVQVDRGWRVANADRRQVEQLRTEIRKEAPKPPAELPPQPKFERAVADASGDQGRDRSGRQAADTERLGVPGTPAGGARSGAAVGAPGTDAQPTTAPATPPTEGKERDRAKRREGMDRQRPGSTEEAQPATTPSATTPSTAMPDATTKTPGTAPAATEDAERKGTERDRTKRRGRGEPSAAMPETAAPSTTAQGAEAATPDTTDAAKTRKEKAADRGKKRDRSQGEQPGAPSATTPDAAPSQAPATTAPESEQPRKGRPDTTGRTPRASVTGEAPQTSGERRGPGAGSERPMRDAATPGQSPATVAPENEQPRKGRPDRGGRGAESPGSERSGAAERSPSATTSGERPQTSRERRNPANDNARPGRGEQSERPQREARPERPDRGAGRPEASAPERSSSERSAERPQPRAGAPREEGGAGGGRAERPQGGRERGEGGGERGGGRRGGSSGPEGAEASGARGR